MRGDPVSKIKIESYEDREPGELGFASYFVKNDEFNASSGSFSQTQNTESLYW